MDQNESPPSSPDFHEHFTTPLISRRYPIDNLLSSINTVISQVAAEEEAAESSHRRRVAVPRDRVNGQQKLMSHYFDDVQPLYNETTFRRRFRMSKSLFLKIVTDLQEAKEYFQQKRDSSGKQGFTPLQKCTAAIRQLAYGTVSDSFDEYLQMSERTARESLLEFCSGIVELYRPRYLRRPTESDIRRIYSLHNRVHGFPGMLGSIDCMHWVWEMCPTAWRGTHTRGDIGKPSLMLQAVASQDLWIWHAFFGMQGSLNDINVFESSPILEELVSGLVPKVRFMANGTRYDMGYYLGDGIYPEYAIFVKTFTHAIDEKRQFFKMRQEAARKDIERAFGVLKKRWKMIATPCRLMDKQKMKVVMYACIILHNMILEDEGNALSQAFDPDDPSLAPDYWTQQTPMEQRQQNLFAVKNREIHNMLKADLVEHVWANAQQVQPEPDSSNDGEDN